MRGFKCLVCGYEGLDFKLNLRTYTYAVGRVVGNTDLINPAQRCLEDKYDQENAKRGLICPRCSEKLRPLVSSLLPGSHKEA